MKVPFAPNRKLIRRKAAISTVVRTVGYDPHRAVLQVELSNGAVYDYVGVSQEEYDAFMDAESKGRHYSLVIKLKHGEHCFMIREGETLAH
jgi:hypothetical protein